MNEKKNEQKIGFDDFSPESAINGALVRINHNEIAFFLHSLYCSIK